MKLGKRMGRLLGRSRDESLIAFVHIPKTAGGTIKSMFDVAYTDAGLYDAGNYFRDREKAISKLDKPERVWEAWREQGGRVMIGHVPYGLMRRHLPTDTRYITFMRDTVDRVLSNYYREFGGGGDPARRRSAPGASPRKGRPGSLEEAMVALRLPQLNNFATRLLCGEAAPEGDLAPTAVEDAKANLRSFAFVGITERFDESLALLQGKLGLGAVPYQEKRHVNRQRPPIEDTPHEQRELILEHNQLDAELYAYAQDLFEQALAGAGRKFQASVDTVREFGVAADAYTEESIERTRAWLEREVPVGSTRSVEELRIAAEQAGITKRTLREASRRLGLEQTAAWTRSETAPSQTPDSTAATNNNGDASASHEASPPENVATHAVRRRFAHADAREWQEVGRMIAPGFSATDMREGFRRTLTVDEWHEGLYAIVENTTSTFVCETVATHGELSTLEDVRLQGTDQHGRDFGTRFLMLADVDDVGRFRRAVAYDTQDIDRALEELESS